ncbi:MAG: ATP-binding protein [Eubacteriales bacterium]|nr:ATP-binding protein [Eubacteriales bacterium]
MALSKEQYDSIMLRYANTQNRRRRELDRRRSEVYARIPEYRALESEVPSEGMRLLRARLLGEDGVSPCTASPKHGDTPPALMTPKQSAASGSAVPAAPLQKQISEVAARKSALLSSHGFPADYLEVPFTCPDCRDTGFIGNEKCHCFRAQEITLLYNQSGIQELARTNNFATLSDEFYHGDDLKRFQRTLMICRDFVANFPSRYKNIYFYGTVGTGKSFLSVCIAHELIEKGYAVLYFSASSLFERISACSFDYRARQQQRDLYQDLYGCDLLIIDDLGTELTNAFVNSELFACLNERALNRKSTIISTNLSLEELKRNYSERVFSRIMSQYELCKLSGPDIRVLLKRRTLRK